MNAGVSYHMESTASIYIKILLRVMGFGHVVSEVNDPDGAVVCVQLSLKQRGGKLHVGTMHGTDRPPCGRLHRLFESNEIM